MGAPQLATLPGAVTLALVGPYSGAIAVPHRVPSEARTWSQPRPKRRIARHSTPGCTFKYLEWLRLGPTLFPRARFFVLGDDDIYLSFSHLQASRPSLPWLQPHVPNLQPHVPNL